MECENIQVLGIPGRKSTYNSCGDQQPEKLSISNSNSISFHTHLADTSASAKGTVMKGGTHIGSGNNSSQIHISRRIFTNEFKLNVLDAFNNHPECIGNQRATARKFGIHRRQVQKWLQQPQTKEESLDELFRTNFSEEAVNARNDLEALDSTRASECENVTVDQISPLDEDLSKMSVNAMALSLNLSMNSLHNSSPHSNPLSLLQLHAPRASPPFYSSKIANRNNSPANLSNSSSGSQNQTVTYNDHLDLVDEISYMYPQEDFNLLRQALLRNEVTFTKIKKRVSHDGRGQLNRAQFTSSPSQSPAVVNNYSAQQALELLRHQSDYVKLLQQSGLNLPFNSDLHTFSDLHSQKYPSWLQQNGQLLSSSNFGISMNGITNKKQVPSHTFVSPKVPLNLKPKTVAAALAASRLSPALKFTMIEPVLKSRISHQRKRQPRQAKSSSIDLQDEEFIDPTTMLEVTSSTVEENGVDLSNHYQSNEIHFGNHTSSLIPFLTVAQLKTSPDRNSGEFDPEMTKYLALEAYTSDPEVAGDARALARKFGLNIRVVMKWIKESSCKYTLPSGNSVRVNGVAEAVPTFTSCNNLLMANTIGNGNGSLDMTMLKTIKTEHSKTQLNFPNICSKEDPKNKSYIETDDLSLQSANLHKHILANMNSSSNKRKNSKPNQICDFVQGDNICFNDGPVDMMVPIKKRRLSTQD